MCACIIISFFATIYDAALLSVSAFSLHFTKNINSVKQVNKNIGLSPGKFTRRLWAIRESQSRKRKAIAKSKEAKRRRLELKARRWYQLAKICIRICA